jgi:S1-C subfamily serine protease
MTFLLAPKVNFTDALNTRRSNQEFPKEYTMATDSDDFTGEAPVETPRRDEPILAVTRHGRVSLNIVAALVLVIALAGMGFVFGHFVFTSSQTRVTSPTTSNSNSLFPGFGNFTFPSTTPSNGSSSATPSKAADAAAAKIAKSVDKGLVDINTNLSYEASEAAGTGMVLTSNGLVLTNNHVIEGATSITARDVNNNKVYTATVVGYDISKDVAILQLKDASGLATVSLGNSSKVTKGEQVVGIGNAGGVGGTPSYAAGTVLALHQSLTASDSQAAGGSENLSGMIEMNAAIEPGDSGGPLANTKGKVIGIDTAAATAGGGFGFQNFTSNVSQAYAIPINTALSIAKSIEHGDSSVSVHIGGTAFMGVEIVPANQASQYNATTPATTTGVAIEGIISGSPAAQSALATGDVITSLDNQSVTTTTALESILQTLKPGDTVQVGYVNQSGVTESLSLTLSSGPAQ